MTEQKCNILQKNVAFFVEMVYNVVNSAKEICKIKGGFKL